MGLLASIRPSPAPSPAVVVLAAAAAVAELEDGDLEQVVGGLERVYIPELSIARG